MLRAKMMLFSVLMVALAVPSLWAQKKEESAISRLSINQIKQLLQERANAAGTPAAAFCVAGAGDVSSSYFSATNKCSSGNANLGSLPAPGSNSRQKDSTTCSDKGGVEVIYDSPRTIGAVGPGQAFAGPWNQGFSPLSVENSQPDVYGDETFIATSIGLGVKRPAGTFGFEISNTTEQTYNVTFSGSSGTLATVNAVPAGGTVEPDVFANRVFAVCNTPAITAVTIVCTSCFETHGAGQNWIAQIRSDKFLGF